jgi:hypothetical protein
VTTIRQLIEREGKWFGGREKLIFTVRRDGPAILSPALKRFNKRNPQLAMPLSEVPTW